MSGIKAARPKPWTAAEVEAVSRWQAEGLSYAEQGRRLGRSRWAVKGAVVQYDLGGHPRKWAAGLKADILAHIGDGLGLATVARRVGRSRNVVWRHVREMAARGVVRLRGRGRSARWVPTRRWTLAD